MRPHIVALVIAVIFASVALAQQADPTAAARASAAVLLADAAVVPWDVARADRGSPPDEWRERAQDILCLVGRQGWSSGCVLTDLTGQRLLDFMSPRPVAPVPMALLPVEEARKTALDFAQRHLPELAGTGGEVTCTVEDHIAPHGAYLVTCQRLEQGVAVPTRALVGVRVYDGKIVRWRPEHQPVTADLTLTITKEQAQEIAAKNVPGNTLEPVMWLDARPEIVVLPDGQRCVWTVWAELKTKNSGAPRLLECFGHWQIEAKSGVVLQQELVKPTPERFFWYAAKGGPRWPESGRPLPEALGRDSSPVASPDGSRLVFTSDRPREGYPLWMAPRSWSLFIVNRDGSDLACLPATQPSCARWSPDGKAVAWSEAGALILLDLASGQKTRLAAPAPMQYNHYTWLPDGRIVAIADRFRGDTRLHLLDPKQPASSPVELPQCRQAVEQYAALLTDAQGRLLVVINAGGGATRDNERIQKPFRLVALSPATPDAPAQELVQYFPGSDNLQWTPSGRLLARASRGGAWVTMDPASWTAEEWHVPRVLQPARQGQYSVFDPQGISWSGSEMFLVAQYHSGNKDDAPAQVIYACQPDGSNSRLVTRPDSAVVPAWAAK